MEVVITKSKKPDKKYDARIDGAKTVSFGQKGASDFTKHKDKDRQERFWSRMGGKDSEKTKDPFTGCFSRKKNIQNTL